MPATDLPKISQSKNSFSAKPAEMLPEAWTDEEFREAFESLKIANEMFHHREHIRMAWIYSCVFPQEEALARIVERIQAFAKHHNVSAKYHHTITVVWMRLVWHAVGQASPAPDFNAFALAHPRLFDPRLLEYYYSKARLQSDAARHNWLEPDLRPLP